MKKTSSLVWRFFDRLEENNRCVAVVCKLCDTQYKYFGNTTNLRTHLVNKHPIQWELLQNGTLESSTFRNAFEEDESTNQTVTPKKRKYSRVYKEENDVNVLELSDAENGNDDDLNIHHLETRGSDEEWLNDEIYETVETYEPKRKNMKYKTIKTEVQTPQPRVSSYYLRPNVKYQKPTQVITESPRKDEYGIFGEYVANKLRKLKSAHSRANVQQLMTTILWGAEYGMYENMETVKRVILHSVQEMHVPEMEAIPMEQVIVQEPEAQKVDEVNV